MGFVAFCSLISVTVTVIRILRGCRILKPDLADNNACLMINLVALFCVSEQVGLSSRYLLSLVSFFFFSSCSSSSSYSSPPLLLIFFFFFSSSYSSPSPPPPPSPPPHPPLPPSSPPPPYFLLFLLCVVIQPPFSGPTLLCFILPITRTSCPSTTVLSSLTASLRTSSSYLSLGFPAVLLQRLVSRIRFGILLSRILVTYPSRFQYFNVCTSEGQCLYTRIIYTFLYCTETKESTRKTEEKLDGRYKDGHERKKPKWRPVGR